MISPDDVVDPIAMGMQAHPEGAWYRETWRHATTISTPHGERALVTCVALRPGERSSWHRVHATFAE